MTYSSKQPQTPGRPRPDQTSLFAGHYTDLLAPWTYSSPEFHRLEIDTLFRSEWLCAGHISELASIGDFVTFDAFGEQVLVIRDSGGSIRAMHNVCRHRGSRVLAAQRGRCRASMTCPFHGWTYSLAGELQGVPAADTFANLDKSSLGLASVEHELWCGFVFIRLAPGGAALSTTMAGVTEELSLYLPEQLVPLQAESVEHKPYNWKLIHDVDNEGYHVPVGHPALQQLYGDTYLDSIENGIMLARATIRENPGRNWSVRHYQKLLPAFAHLPEERQRMWFYVQLFPNMVIGCYPDMVEVYMTIPESPVRTRYISRTYALPDERPEARASRYLNMRINSRTAVEDDSFVRWLHHGMQSSAWYPPVLSSLEEGVRFFHHHIQRKIPVGRLATEPEDHALASLNRQMLDESG